MMLLTFSGLDQREQLSVLSSVGNEYDLRKVSHAMQIQFPQSSGKPVYRKGYLGCGRGSSYGAGKGGKWKPTASRFKQQVLASEVVEEYDDADDYDGDAYFEGDENDDEEVLDESYVASYSKDDTLDALLTEGGGNMDDPEVAEAFATVAQYRQKGKGHQPEKSQPGPASSQSYPFKAEGDTQFDGRAKENRKNAIRFLKSMSTCSSCNRRGHWVGDSECPNYKPKGKGRGGNSKKPSGAQKKPSEFHHFA